MSNIRSEPLRGEKRSTTPPIGVIPPGGVEHAFIALLYTAVILLAWLSVVGTFYGMRGLHAPLHPFAQWAAIIGALDIFVQALALQVVLTLAQWGGRQLARNDRRWWFLYLAALGISVYYNMQAYYDPLTAILSPAIVLLLIVAGDILPEFVAVKHH